MWFVFVLVFIVVFLVAMIALYLGNKLIIAIKKDNDKYNSSKEQEGKKVNE